MSSAFVGNTTPRMTEHGSLNGFRYGSTDSLSTVSRDSVGRDSLRSVSRESLRSVSREDLTDIDGLVWDRWKAQVSSFFCCRVI